MLLPFRGATRAATLATVIALLGGCALDHPPVIGPVGGEDARDVTGRGDGPSDVASDVTSERADAVMDANVDARIDAMDVVAEDAAADVVGEDVAMDVVADDGAPDVSVDVVAEDTTSDAIDAADVVDVSDATDATDSVDAVDAFDVPTDVCPPCAFGTLCCGGTCVASSTSNCGACGVVCPSANGTSSCTSGACAIVCNTGFQNCSGNASTGCETNLLTDNANCGACGNACGAGTSCVNGNCAQFVSTGADGPFAPTTDVALAGGIHNFTTVDIPANVTVTMQSGAGGVLEIRATGAVTIEGTIDVSGGPGSTGSYAGGDTGEAGNGGDVGTPTTALGGMVCQQGAGENGYGPDDPGSATGIGCAPLAAGTCESGTASTTPDPSMGGGGGMYVYSRAHGSGGGGPAGGGGGRLGAPYSNVWDPEYCTITAGGGAMLGAGGSAGGAPYDGASGVTNPAPCGGYNNWPPAPLGGGGGGSIGTSAAADLAMSTTFRSGSGGGGGSADYVNRPSSAPTAGGGGGGGALRISSIVSISITGRVLANGGAGGDAFTGTDASAGCTPEPGAAGGGGSGGAIYLYAPSLDIGSMATLSAVGGGGGAPSSVVAMSAGAGGAGGLGRIRIAAGSTCSISGTMNPPVASGCAASAGAGTPGQAFVSVWPN